MEVYDCALVRRHIHWARGVNVGDDVLLVPIMGTVGQICPSFLEHIPSFALPPLHAHP